MSASTPDASSIAGPNRESRSRCSKRRKRSTRPDTSACSRVRSRKRFMSAATPPSASVASSSPRRRPRRSNCWRREAFMRLRVKAEPQREPARRSAGLASGRVASACRRTGCACSGAGTGARSCSSARSRCSPSALRSSASVPCRSFWVRPRDRASSTASTSSPPASILRARAISIERQSSAWACSAWISGIEPRWSSQWTKLCTPTSMIASACATAASRFSPAICTSAERSSTV